MVSCIYLESVVMCGELNVFRECITYGELCVFRECSNVW